MDKETSPPEPSRRRPWQTPELVVYGDLRELTRATPPKPNMALDGAVKLGVPLKTG